MRIRFSGICGVISLLLLLGNGCKKSSDTGAAGGTNAVPGSIAAAKAAAPAPDTIARVHWLGKKGIAADTNSAHLMTIWNLSETARLGAQTLDKLAIAPWRMRDGWSTNTPATNAASALLRPLLDDLVNEEWYLEARSLTNQPGELVLSIRLDDQRAALWQTNLAAALEDLTGIKALPAPGGKGWSLKKHDVPNLIELGRAGEWTLVGLANDTNPLRAEVSDRVQRTRSPASVVSQVAATPGPEWLRVEGNLQRFGSALGRNWKLPVQTPAVVLALSGDGENVRTRGTLNFPNPLPFEVEPWTIPTNLIHEPLFSFTAMQGIQKLLSSSALWKALSSGPPPAQIYSWAQSGAPLMQYLAASSPNASNTVEELSQTIPGLLNPIIGSNRMGTVEKSTNFHGLTWSRAPLILPFLRSEGNFVYAALAPDPLTNRPAPPSTIRELLGGTNLVYYDREMTGPRVEAWLYMTQLGRIVFRRVQLTEQQAVIPWFKAIGPKALASVTSVSKTTPQELTFDRTSSLGFTAPELHALADWLESPQFPFGSHTLLAKLPPPRPRPIATNAPPSFNAPPAFPK